MSINYTFIRIVLIHVNLGESPKSFFSLVITSYFQYAAGTISDSDLIPHISMFSVIRTSDRLKLRVGAFRKHEQHPVVLSWVILDCSFNMLTSLINLAS